MWRPTAEDLPHSPSGQVIVQTWTLVLATILLGLQQVRTISNICIYGTGIALAAVSCQLSVETCKISNIVAIIIFLQHSWTWNMIS